MNRNYIIFFWIICLILFTFYCVFRLKYLSDNTNRNTNTNRNRNIKENYEGEGDDTSTSTSTSTTTTTTTKSTTTTQRVIPQLTAYTGDVLVTLPARTTVPMVTQVSDFITYIKNIQDKGKITDMVNCEELYDDNIKVKELGYRNCEAAYLDYLDKNYNLNNTYGNKYTLAEICPIASKSPEYENCLTSLLNKFTDSVNLVDSVNKDMDNSINSRLNVRTDNLYKIQESINPFIYSKVQNNFINDMLMKKQIGTKNEDKLNLVNKYYQDKYKVNIESFTNTNTNTNTLEQFTNITLNDIEKLFFGKYKPVKGQFETLTDVVFTVEYDDSDSDSYSYSDTNTNQESTEPTNTTEQSTTLSKLSPLSVKSNARPVIFTLSNNDIYITYKVSNIDYYKLNKNTIKLILTNKKLVYQSSPTNIVDPLLTQLGLYSPSSINLIFDPYTSTENKKHDTYKLVNDNLDTILILEKLPNPITTQSTSTYT